MPQRYRKPSTFLDYMCEYLSRQKNYLFAKSVCRAKNSISKIEGLAEQAPCMSKAPLDRADLLLEIGIPGFPHTIIFQIRLTLFRMRFLISPKMIAVQ